MQTLHLLFFTFPIVLEGCCAGINKKILKATAGLTCLQQDTIHQHLRAVEGESFMMPCINCGDGHINVVWFRIGNNSGENEASSFYCGRVYFPAEAKHTGKYKCLTKGGEMFLHLQVVEKSRVGYFQPEKSNIDGNKGAGKAISCPGHNLIDNTEVTWYKGNISVSELRDSCVENGQLHLCYLKDKNDDGVYFCDRQVMEEGVTWTFRRAVNVKVVPHRNTAKLPRINYPDASRPEEDVELGRSHNLTCKVFFPYEKKVSAKVQWFMNYRGNTKRRTLLDMVNPETGSDIDEEYWIMQRAIIKTVTHQHLNHTYTCFASNTVGNNSVTIRFKQSKVKWQPPFGYSIAILMLAVGMAITLHVKSLELQIIYRSHFQCGKQNREKKQFDVFLSHVWSSTSAEKDGCWILSSPSGLDADEEACQHCRDLMNTEVGEANQKPQVMLLHQVLEEQWGYRLCLLERDFVPGGAYANDVVGAIQRSHMLICLLSADYLSNSNAVFVLESGIQALLQKSAPKLLLIWTCSDSATLVQKASLPPLVQRAMKVLPSLYWPTEKPNRASCDFWRSLKKAMPNHRVKLESMM